MAIKFKRKGGTIRVIRNAEYLAKAYSEPNLPNLFCANECLLGQAYVAEVELKDLSLVTLEILNLLNRLSKQKDRLIEITADGEITPDE